MFKHLKYLRYVIRHKWFVFIECCKLGIPWRGLVHDLSKFRWSEWRPYVWSFNGPWKYDDRPLWLRDIFNKAWLLHQHRNPHHWQFWCLRCDTDGETVLQMPDCYMREMLADWRGANKAQGGDGKADSLKWYEKNRAKMVLHPDTRIWIEGQLGFVGDPMDGDSIKELKELTIRLSVAVSDYTQAYGGESSTMDMESANVRLKSFLKGK